MLSVEVYVPLANRFRGACRCPVCAANPNIVKFYLNDVLCKFDGLPCFSVDDSGVRVCFQKRGGRVCFCDRFVKGGF